MRNGLSIVTQPPVEPVALTQLRTHLRVEHTADDVQIALYGKAARIMAERYLNRALINTAFLYVLQPSIVSRMLGCGPSRWTRPIEMPRSPLVSIQSVTINDVDGNRSVLPSGAFIVETATTPGRVTLDYRAGLINPVAALQDIQIAFTAGYGVDATNIPVTIIQAILVTTAFLYEHRGDAGGELPRAATWLLDVDRVDYFGG